MQIEIKTDLNTLPQVIDWNHEALKAQLAARLEKYNGLVITEDTIKEGKTDKANLNKLREAVEGERKRIKKLVMQPYNKFERQCKELVALIDQPIAAIDSQLKDHEEKRKEAKKAEIQEAYDALITEDLREIIPLERIMDPRWLNATTSMKKVEEDLDLTYKKTRTNLQVVDMVPAAYRTAVRAKYIETLDVAAALDYQKQLQAAEKAAKPEAAAEVEQTTLTPEPTAKWAKPEPAVPGEKLYKLRLEFDLTKAQANQLKQFLEEARIAYTKI